MTIAVRTKVILALLVAMLSGLYLGRSAGAQEDQRPKRLVIVTFCAEHYENHVAGYLQDNAAGLEANHQECVGQKGVTMQGYVEVQGPFTAFK